MEILNFDSFDSYEDYIDTSLARSRREKGQRAQADLETWHNRVERNADLTGQHPGQLHRKTLMEAPHAIAHISNYVSERGYTPSANIDYLCAQLSHAWNEHIQETQETYDPENYDCDNFSFRSKRRQNKRKKRREERKARRARRRAARKAKRAARRARKHKGGEDASDVLEQISGSDQSGGDQSGGDSGGDSGAINQGGGNQGNGVQFGADSNIGNEDQVNDDQPVTAEVEEAPDTTETEALAAPDDVEAEAENFGVFLEQDNYDGDPYELLPYYGSAMYVGNEQIQNMRDEIRAGNFDNFDLSKIGDLFKKKPGGSKLGNLLRKVTKKISIDDALKMSKGGKETDQVIKKTVNKISKDIEHEKKVNFLKDNAIWIVLGVVLLVIIGRSMSSKKY